MRIVETDNFDGDYPDEKFVNLPSLFEDEAEAIAEQINVGLSGPACPRYWKVVADDYQLRPGFEP